MLYLTRKQQSSNKAKSQKDLLPPSTSAGYCHPMCRWL